MKRRDFMKATGALAGGAALGGLPLVAIGQNKKISLKFDSYISESAGPSRLDEWFLSQLESRTNGDVNIRRYWAASLNKVGEHLAAVRDNTSEMSLISPGYYQAELPVTRGLEWYFRMGRSDALQQVCRDVYDQFEPLRQEWEQRHRAKVLYWTNWNYAPMITREPINSIQDLKGKRIRGYGVASDVIERLGGTAVPMAAPEVYTALERGVLDGVYGFDFITAVAYKLHEIAPHFTDIGDGPHAPSTTVMNMGVWEAMPADVQQVCNEIVDEIYDTKYAEIVENHMAEYVQTALNEGVKFNVFSDEQKLAAKDIVQPAQVESWKKNVAAPAGIDGDAMQKIVEEAIAKHEPNGRLKRPSEIAAEL